MSIRSLPAIGLVLGLLATCNHVVAQTSDLELQERSRRQDKVEERATYRFPLSNGALRGDSLLTNRHIYDSTGALVEDLRYDSTQQRTYRWLYDHSREDGMTRDELYDRDDALESVLVTIQEEGAHTMYQLRDGDTIVSNREVFDEQGRPAGHWVRFYSGPWTQNVRYHYRVDGLVDRLEVLTEDGSTKSTTTYEYDTNGLVFRTVMTRDGVRTSRVVVRDSGGRTISIEELDEGTRESTLRQRITKVYDDAGKLIEERTEKASGLVELERYYYRSRASSW